jgi:hypothetical protein
MGIDWHGWSLARQSGPSAVSLHIGRHPYRKQVALMASIPNYGLVALGYFRTESAARVAMDMIDALVDNDVRLLESAAEEYRQREGVTWA